MNSQEAYPLSWPAGWPRTNPIARKNARFHSVTRGKQWNDGYVPIYRRTLSMADVIEQLLGEVRRFRASSVVISSNVALRVNGHPYSNRTPPADPGAAAYFTLKNIPIALACDKWRRVEDNVSAIARHIEALRLQSRLGVGNVERAFAGYARLMEPGQTAAAVWYSVLGVSPDASFDVARAAYIAEAKQKHPDISRDNGDGMRELNTAWDQARKYFGK